jgi:hypothetical protein
VLTSRLRSRNSGLRRKTANVGGRNECLRQHRIGYFRLQARGACDWGGRIAFATAFIVRDSSIAEACGRRRGACDWGSRIAFATAFIVRDSLIAEACGRRRSAWCNRGNTDLESRRRSDSCQSRR